MFSSLDTVKPALKKLVSALSVQFPYASVLAVEDAWRRWSVSRSGVSLSASGFGGGTGFVVRVFDGTGCAEYSFNEFSQEDISCITAVLTQRLAALEGFEPLPTPIPADGPAQLKRATPCRVDPGELGDEAILNKLKAIREKALAVDGRLLDASLGMAYRSCRKIFLSPNRDLDQTLTWTTCSLSMLAARGQELKAAYRPFSALGGAEVLDQVEAAVPEVAAQTLELLDYHPNPPGEY